jgi:hypothetical protein
MDRRQKRISLTSVAPLDRILNQFTQVDELMVRVGCNTKPKVDPLWVRMNDGSELQMNSYDFNFGVPNVNRATCLDSEEDALRSKGVLRETCNSIDELTCAPGAAYTIEIFDRQGSNGDMNKYMSIGFLKIPYEKIECLWDHEVQVHFQYGKRNTLTGATVCYDHKE